MIQTLLFERFLIYSDCFSSFPSRKQPNRLVFNHSLWVKLPSFQLSHSWLKLRRCIVMDERLLRLQVRYPVARIKHESSLGCQFTNRLFLNIAVTEFLRLCIAKNFGRVGLIQVIKVSLKILG